MTPTWYVCDMKTGDVLNTLPLRPTGQVERTVGAASTLGVRLNVLDKRCPPNWEGLLDKRRVMIVLDDDGIPLVGYRIVRAEVGEPEVPITLKSLESVLERTFCLTHDFAEGVDDEATAAGALVSDRVVPGWGFELAVTPTGKTADHSYTREEDRTVASALADLMGTDGGPEWTIRLRWETPAQRRIIKTIQIGPRIGNDLPGTVVDNKYLKSRKRITSAEGDNLATSVIATSDGSGVDRPMSAEYVDQAALDAGVPPWEARIHVTGVDEPAELNRVAETGLRQRWNGVTTWEMLLAATNKGCPRPGRDFDAGDTITVQSGPTAHDKASWNGPARLVGWRAEVVESQFSTVTPVLWEDKEVGAT